MSFKILPLILSLAATFFLTGMGSPNRPAETREYELLRERAQYCGLNSLYILMIYSNYKIDYDKLKHLTEIDDHSSSKSLLKLRNVSKSVGFDTQVRYHASKEIEDCRLPFIAHLEPMSGNKGELGHFIVVTSVNDGDIETIDGTTGEIAYYEKKLFPNIWSGYTLEIEPFVSRGRIALFVCIFSFAIFFVVKLSAVRKCLRRIYVGCGIILIGLNSNFTPSAHGCIDESHSLSIDNSGQSLSTSYTNILYIFLNFYDVKVDYEIILKDFQVHGDASLVRAREIASSHGLNLVLKKCNIQELEDLSVPVIAFLDNPTCDGGEPLILLNIDDETCRIVRGDLGFVDMISPDAFRRHYNGIVLAPKRQSVNVYNYVLYFVLASALGISIARRVRRVSAQSER